MGLSSNQGLPEVAMAAVTSERKIILLRQLRPDSSGTPTPVWNLPRGPAVLGASLLDEAIAQFMRKTGLTLDPRQAKVLGDIRADNELILNTMTLCWAPLDSMLDTWAPPSEEEQGVLEVGAFDLSGLRKMLMRDELQDGYLLSSVGLMHINGLL